ncbi:MAG: nickel-binding protein [Planctomycetota bacterium]|jgi:hypothetical protein
MSMDRSYLNFDDGFGLCIWDAPSQEALGELFKKAGTPFEKMIAVQEHLAEHLTNA